MPWHIVFLEDLCPFCLYQDILDSGIVSSASCSCWLSAAWCPESVSSEELPLAPTMHSSMSLSLSHSELESEAGWIFFWLSCTIEVKIFTVNMCLHHPHFLVSLSFKCNILVINIKFKFTYSIKWQLVSVTEIFPVNVIVFLLLSFCTLPVICSM